jgi:6-phosphogluconolactonase
VHRPPVSAAARRWARATLCAAALPWAGAAGAAAAPATPAPLRVYVGTYTTGDSVGIYRLRLDGSSGALTAEGEPTQSVNPSFLALHPGGRFLYAVNELGESRGDEGGAVSAYAVDPATGGLTLLNQRPSGGAAPCHLSLDAEGRYLFVANYWGGSVSVFPVGADGRLGPASGFVQHEGPSPTPREDMGPHAHFVALDPAQRFAVVADLGLDAVFVYRFDRDAGRLGPDPFEFGLAPGAGPRHFTFHPDGRHAYVIDELDSTIVAFDYDAAAGTLEAIQTVSTKPRGFARHNDTAEIAVRPDGRFVYGSNRGHDSIAIFAVDGSTGKLAPAGFQSTRGRTPRSFAIDPTGTFLLAANQDSDSVAVFRIDPSTGALVPVGDPVSVPRPVCLLPAP